MLPARGSWSRNRAALRVSNTQQRTPRCARYRARHRPTGPAPTIRTGSDSADRCVASVGRLYVLDRATPAARGDVEDDALGIAVLHFVIAVRRIGRPSLEMDRAGLLHLLLRLLEV